MKGGNDSLYYICTEDELYHYGIRGQKWGVRRFQNPDGTLTTEGKARYSTDKEMKSAVRKEVKSDNKRAYELGKKATVDSHAAYIASRKALKAQVKYDKKPKNRKLDKLEAKQRTAERLKEQAKKSRKTAEEHIRELMSKYGDEAVKGLVYDSKGRVSEHVNNGKDWLESAGLSAMGTAIGMIAMPAITGGAYGLYMLFTPAGKHSQGQAEYRDIYREEMKKQRGLH